MWPNREAGVSSPCLPSELLLPRVNPVPVKEKPPLPLINTSFTRWVQPLWEGAVPTEIEGTLSQPGSEWGDISQEERRIRTSELAHLWLPASFILSRNMAVCLDFRGRSSREIESWLRDEYYPTQGTKRRQIAKIIQATVNKFSASPIGRNVWEFMQEQGYETVWRQVCDQAGYNLDDLALLQPRFDGAASSDLMAELTGFSGNLRQLEPFLQNRQLLPRSALVLFEKALAVQLAEDKHEAQIFYQPDMIVAFPDEIGNWQVGIWDLKLGKWKGNMPWGYTLAFYHKVASALCRSLNERKTNQQGLLSAEPLNLQLRNRVEPGAYGLLLFLKGEPVATKSLSGVDNLQVPDLPDEDFWKLSQILFKVHQEDYKR